MNETSVKTSTCLTITEKRQQNNNRPAGCVGIFFQLFDWNRRFAKKKLFSRKLLPPARARQASKKFAGDEKMPKIKPQLTIEENSEAFFPGVKKNVKCEQNHDMKTPSLVARLMGLESLPTIPQDKSKKAAIPCSDDIKEEKVASFNRSGDDLSLEKGNTTRIESRPQKIRKTNPSERRAVTRFCTESLQIKNVLSKSRQRPKLLSPEKSPRISSSRSSYRTSRLMIDAATKILEPGLQATNRAKCALTYRSSSVHFTQKDELLTEEIVVMSPHLMNDKSGCDRTVCLEPIIGQTSCNLLGVLDSQQKFDKHPFVYRTLNLNNASTQEQDGEVVFGRTPDRPAREKDNKCSKRKSQPQEGSVQCHSTKLPHKVEPVKHRAQTQNQIFSSKNRTPPRPKSSNSKCRRVSSSGSKDFVVLNRSISGQTTQMRMPAKVDNSTVETRKKSSNTQDESLSHVRSTARKRRTDGDNRLVKSTMTKQTNASCDVTSGEQTRGNSRTCISNRLARQEKVDRANNTEENDVNSFTFSSSARQKSRISAQKEKKNVHRDLHSKQTVSKENESNGQKLPFKTDDLGILLQQRLKELSSQEDELTIGPKRSTAVILQELISALTTGQPVPQEYHMFNRDIVFQSKAKTGGNVVESLYNGDHFSPGSVLEASFSNGSCFSSSMDDNSVSGHRVPFDSMDCSSDQPPLAHPDGELLDSATSSSKDESCYELVSVLLNQISTTLDSIKSIDLGTGLSGSKLMHAKAVILNAEIMFTQQNSNGEKLLLVLDILDTLAKALSTDLNCHLGFDETKKENNQVKGFLFDCLIEYLDSKCCQYSDSRRLLPCMNSDMLIREVEIELRKWTQFAGMIHDELLEFEMHHPLEKWTDFHTEAFETGIEIDRDILQVLMEEVVEDFL